MKIGKQFISVHKSTTSSSGCVAETIAQPKREREKKSYNEECSNRKTSFKTKSHQMSITEHNLPTISFIRAN